MSTATLTKVTPEAFLAMPDRDLYELIDGRLVETNMSLLSIRIAGTIFRKLDEFREATRIGWAWPPKTFVRCFADRTRFRKSDACFVRLDRIPSDWIEEAALDMAPDLVVEVLSPNDTAYDVKKKLVDYLGAGVRLVWVVYPETRTVSVHRIDRTVADLSSDEDLDGEDVIPGFRCPIASLFPVGPAKVSERV